MYPYIWKRAVYQNQWELAENSSSSVTFLVPAHLLPRILRRIRSLEWKPTEYFRSIIANCRCDLADGDLIHRAAGYTTEYQQSDQGLVRLPMRLDAELWMEFTQICRFYGLSR